MSGSVEWARRVASNEVIHRCVSWRVSYIKSWMYRRYENFSLYSNSCHPLIMHYDCGILLHWTCAFANFWLRANKQKVQWSTGTYRARLVDQRKWVTCSSCHIVYFLKYKYWKSRSSATAAAAAPYSEEVACWVGLLIACDPMKMRTGYVKSAYCISFECDTVAANTACCMP